MLILDTYYEDFLAQWYARNPQMASLSYDQQWRALQDQCFGTADFYSTHLNELGHEAREVVMNCEPLQRQWAAEQGIRHPSSSLIRRISRRFRPAKGNWLYVVLLEQIKSFRPDILYVLDMNWLDSRFVKEIRALAKSVVGQVACPIAPGVNLGNYDLIISSFPHFVDRFRRAGLASEYMKLAFEPKVGRRLTKQSGYDVVFVGHVSASHQNRLQFLERIGPAVGLDVWGPGVESLAPGSPLRGSHHGLAWGLEMYQILQQSKIVVNNHIDVAESYANNMRLFETTGVGSMLVTDAKRNLGDIFEVDREVIEYHTADEAIEKIRYYLAHDDLREEIALAGQRRTLRDHTFAQRAAEIDRVVRDLMAGQSQIKYSAAN
jgi:hypothetical protein